MDKQQAVERLYDIKGAIKYFPSFKGRAKFMDQIFNMIHFINGHMLDQDLNQRFVDQAEHLLMRANAIVDRMKKERDQQQQWIAF